MLSMADDLPEPNCLHRRISHRTSQLHFLPRPVTLQTSSTSSRKIIGLSTPCNNKQRITTRSVPRWRRHRPNDIRSPDLHELDDEPVLPHLGLQFLHEDWLVALAPFEDPSSLWEAAYRSPEGGPVVLCDGECLVRVCVLAHEV